MPNEVSKFFWMTVVMSALAAGALQLREGWKVSLSPEASGTNEISADFGSDPVVGTDAIGEKTTETKCAVAENSPVEKLVGASASFVGRVDRVIDGDTVVIGRTGGDEVRVRLAGIDAPESRQDFGDKSKVALELLVLDKEVHVEHRGIDQYGRVIGVVRLDDVIVNQRLVADGDAWFWPEYANDLDYHSEQAKADQDKIGLWSNRGAVPPWLYRKLEGIGVFGKAVLSCGFYLDNRGMLHNGRCNVTPRYRWDGTGDHPNCEKCGGSIF